MNSVKIEIYHSLLIPLDFDPIESGNLMENTLSDLCKLKIDFPIDPEIKVKVKVKQIASLKGNRKKLWNLHKGYIRKEIFLKFSSTIHFKDQNYKEFEAEKYSSNDFYVEHILLHDFEKRHYDFLIALGIARVGALHHGIGLMFANGRFIKQLRNLEFHSMDILGYSLEKKWPVFEALDILQTWDWYLTKAFPEGVDEISVGNLGRAINAFSHLYNPNLSEIESLFWSMVGIESLYVSGKENIGDQVKRKAQIFLGEITEFKNRLTKMYDYRSAFIHGSKNFPSYFHIHDALESYDRFIDEYSDAVNVAQSLLIATLQKMAKYKLNHLKFKYTLEIDQTNEDQ